MPGRTLTKWTMAWAAFVTLPLSSLVAQQSLRPDDDSFEVEPPLLVPPSDLGQRADASREEPPDAGKLAQQLTRAKKSAAESARLVKMGVLAKTESEQRALRVIRLESELANAQVVTAQAQVALQKARSASGQQSELAAAMETLTRASAAAQTAEENYQKAQLDAAALNLRRQRQLLALGSAHKSDVARAEEKLDRLQHGDPTSP